MLDRIYLSPPHLGVTTLLAVPDIATGNISGRLHQRHGCTDFLKFLD